MSDRLDLPAITAREQVAAATLKQLWYGDTPGTSVAAVQLSLADVPELVSEVRDLRRVRDELFAQINADSDVNALLMGERDAYRDMIADLAHERDQARLAALEARRPRPPALPLPQPTKDALDAEQATYQWTHSWTSPTYMPAQRGTR